MAIEEEQMGVRGESVAKGVSKKWKVEPVLSTDRRLHYV